MILLDSDHLTVLRYPESAGHGTLTARMTRTAGETFVVSIVSVEEQMRGWLAYISKARDVRGQISAYDRLGRMLDFLAAWRVLAFDSQAAAHFERLRKQRVRIGSQDLKIASIAVANDALLLTANLRDFRQVPGLRVENWLE